MDQNAILALCFIPLIIYWVSNELEWEPATALSGNSRKIVAWLGDSAAYIVTTVTLALGVVSFFLAMYFFFDFECAKKMGWVPWYFAASFSMIVLAGIALFLAKAILVAGKKKGLLQ